MMINQYMKYLSYPIRLLFVYFLHNKYTGRRRAEVYIIHFLSPNWVST